MDANTYYEKTHSLEQMQLQLERESLLEDFWRHADINTVIEAIKTSARNEFIVEVRKVNGARDDEKIGRLLIGYINQLAKDRVDRAIEDGNEN
jgi:hypothetical protein